MGDCDETLRAMEQYLDGELVGEARVHVHSHIEGCLDCLGAFEFHHVLKAHIQRTCRDDLPPGLYDRVLRCLGMDEPGQPALDA